MPVGAEHIEERRSMTLVGSSYPNRFVVYGDAEGQCKPPSSANVDKVIGVLQGVNDNTTLISTLSKVEVVTKGRVFVETDAAVEWGEDAMVADSAGKAGVAEHATPVSTYITGTFEETTTDAGLALLNLDRKGMIKTV